MTFNAPSYSDSPRNATNYLGQNYRFTPCYIRRRNPVNGTGQSNLGDVKPKENQGRYPIGSIWVNISNPPEIWILSAINANGAQWVLIANSLLQGPLLTLSDNAGTVVTPSSDVANPPGNIQFLAGAGIGISAGTHTITITNTGAGTETLKGDDGVAVGPDGGGSITTVGAIVANGTNAKALFVKNTAANTDTWQLQFAAANAATDATKVGVAAFNSTQFSVDANGFVSLSGAVSPLGLTPDAHTAPGTSPVVQDGSGHITLEGGATFATGTRARPIRTNSLAANTMDFEIQLAGSNAGALTANNFGVAQFDSNQFSVVNGFVQLAGGTTAAIEKVNVQTGTTPIVPASSAITINGAVVAAGTNPVRTDGTGASTMAIEIQKSQAIAATDATKIGLSNFNSAQFSVDANGFVSLVNGSTISQVNLDAATTPIMPSAGAITLTGGQVATGVVGANVIRTRGNTASSATIEIQRSTVSAVTNSTLNGVCHFDSSKFGVDMNGFVTFTGVTGAFPWTDEGGNFAAASNNGYFCTALLTATLPPTPAQGDVIRIVSDTASVVTLQANTGQSIRMGNAISAVAGTAASTRQGDSLDLVYRSSSATWYCVAGVTGSWTIT